MDDIEFKILIGLHRNVNDLDRITSKIVSKYNLTLSQFAVLEALYSKGDMSVGEVREVVLSSVGTIPVVINNLVKMNYIERLSNKKDRRVCILHLTDEGNDLINKIKPENDKAIIERFKLLNKKEMNDLLSLLKTLGGK